MSSTATTTYLGLGANLGHREQNIARALELLSEKVKVEEVSPLYETEPVGYRDQPSFLNGVCRGETELGPGELLRFIKDIERRLGRHPSFPNAPRPIDIDILFYADQIIETAALTIPHPRLAERLFVLVPLADIAPRLVHPLRGKTIAELLTEVAGQGGVRPWKGATVSQGGSHRV